MIILTLAAALLLTACGPTEADQTATAEAQTLEYVALQETAMVAAMLNLTQTEAAKPPTETPTTTPTSTETPAPVAPLAPLGVPTNPLPGGSGSGSGQSALASETIPDGTRLNPGQSFTKKWQLLNNGSSTWSTGYSLAFINGEQMNAKSEVYLPVPVAPGALVDISVPMTAPKANGTYQGDWRLRDENGNYFGAIIWVKIEVGPPLPTAPVAKATAIPVICPPYDPSLPYTLTSVEVYEVNYVGPSSLQCGTDFNLIVIGAINKTNPGMVEYTWEIDGVVYDAVDEYLCSPYIEKRVSISGNYKNGNKIPIKLIVWNKGGMTASGDYSIICQ